MSEETKHVLLRTDLEPGFDEMGVLAEIDAMAEGGGAWHDHIPYLAARHFYKGPEVSPQYVKHVDECRSCQRLIDALNPTRKVLDELQRLRRKVEREPVVEEESGPTRERGQGPGPVGATGGVVAAWWSNWHPVQAAAALLVGVGGTLAVMNFEGVQVAPNAQVAAEPASPRPWASEHEFARAFMAAPGLSEPDQREVGFVRVADGYALIKVDEHRVALLAAGEWMDGSRQTLDEELSELLQKEPLTEGERLRMVQLMIEVGRTEEATVSLRMALERGGSGGWAEALKGADIVTAVVGQATRADRSEASGAQG